MGGSAQNAGKEREEAALSVCMRTATRSPVCEATACGETIKDCRAARARSPGKGTGSITI